MTSYIFFIHISEHSLSDLNVALMHRHTAFEAVTV